MDLATAGIHPPDEMPFGDRLDGGRRARRSSAGSCGYHWATRGGVVGRVTGV